MRNLLLLAITSILTLNVKAGILPPLPEYSNEDALWARYCVGDRKSSDIPKPNYQNSEVRSAVKKLVKVSPYSFYFYSGPLFSYELRKGKELVEPPADFPVAVDTVKNGRKNAHAFMTLLCGEFRDRPTLIHDKVRWVNRMYTLPPTPQQSININKELWSQVSAHSYKKYIEISKAIFDAKETDIRSRGLSVKMGKYDEDYPVEPFTVCETKFIFKKYVEVGAKFKYGKHALRDYYSEYNKFKARCPKGDLDYIYDFRGDSNFKPNSPESNGMIWYSSTITNNCTRRNGKYVLKDTAKDKVPDPLICEKYFASPFAYRWSAARAGLAAWVLRDTAYDNTFSAEGESVYIIPNLSPMEKPFSFRLPMGDVSVLEFEYNDQGQPVKWDVVAGSWQSIVMTPEEVAEFQKKIDANAAEIAQLEARSKMVISDYLKSWEASREKFWERPDFGFNEITGLGTKNVNKDLVYERLRDAVNRHTDWYSSGYEDGFGISRDQAYSPFVASSYEMSASDAFTAPGTTVNSPADGCKHWMFVFKLKKDQWYNTLSIQQGKPIDFNKHWFDETSLGTNHLADTEHAFDRLGTALEGEMDTILYLHNITVDGEVNPSCGAEQMRVDNGPEAVGMK